MFYTDYQVNTPFYFSGNKYSIKLLDFYGFECFKQNHLPQFLINCTNELLHYHYLQRIFGWEALETNEEDIPYKPIYYYNNKEALDEMLGKSGLLNLIDTASKMARGGKYVVGKYYYDKIIIKEK